MSPTLLFAVIIGFMVAIGITAAASLFLRRPSRSCPQCTRDVALTAPRCRNCGYAFAPEGGQSRYVR